MGDVIGDLLPLAIAIALSPFPIIGLIVILFAKNARTNSLFFLVGWIVGLAVIAALVIVLIRSGKVAFGAGTEDTGVAVISLLIGLALLYFGFVEWKQRPKEGEVPEEPKWMASVDHIKPRGAIGLGFFLSAINPKNLLLGIGACVIIARAPLDTTQTIIATLIYILIASLSILGAVIYYQFAGESAEKTLGSLKVWLVQNNTAIMAVLLFVFGAKFVGDFIGSL
jgi:threonine/homoserine/homoserine lactone efflux protein